MNYDWSFERLSRYTEAFAVGTLTTLELSALVVLIGTVAGIVLGISITKKWVARLLYPIIDVVRAVPPLVLLLFFYFALTVDVVGFAIPGYWVFVIAMSVNLAAFLADLVRSALTQIDRALIDSTRALGFTQRQALVYLILPRALRHLIAPTAAMYIGMIKLSSLASVINVAEVVYVAQTVIADISRSLEAWVIVAAIYVSITLPLSYGLRYLETQLGRGVNSAFSV